MTAVVFDTCVIVDMFMPTRPRHQHAALLHAEMKKRNIKVRIPAFALFEISHAIRQEKRLSGGSLLSGDLAGEANGLSIDLVAVDEGFVKRYLDLNLPELRAGDLVFAALAKGDALPLVTEDGPFRAAAELTGIQVYSAKEYLLEVLKIAA